MKLLLIHSDYIEYEVKNKAISEPEEISINKDRLDEALTVFIAVEKVDEKSPHQAVINAINEITAITTPNPCIIGSESISFIDKRILSKFERNSCIT